MQDGAGRDRYRKSSVRLGAFGHVFPRPARLSGYPQDSKKSHESTQQEDCELGTLPRVVIKPQRRGFVIFLDNDEANTAGFRGLPRRTMVIGNWH